MSVFVLKIIAVVTMIIDHTGAIFGNQLTDNEYWLMRSIGRIAFPIFVYLIAEGARHTRSMPRYLLRLGTFALISEIPFDIFLNLGLNNSLVFLEFSKQNVYFTLFLGALAIYWYKIHRAPDIEDVSRDTRRLFKPGIPIYHWLLVAVIIAAGWFLRTDYSVMGVGLIFACYFFKRKPLRLAAMAAAAVYWYGLDLFDAVLSGDGPVYTLYYAALFIGTLVPAALIALYNGRQGPKLKRFFYFFYPVHMLILSAVYLIITKDVF
ncbi:MAG: conjugal transfer protein TraX [Clostridiales bacterium]|jgi:hypothetical protein|nr:conjugal transfer protein TraX [Clostridiales bacterium]